MLVKRKLEEIRQGHGGEVRGSLFDVFEYLVYLVSLEEELPVAGS